MSAVDIMIYLEMEKFLHQNELIAGITLEGLEGIIDAFHDNVHEARGHQEQILVAQRIRSLLKASKLLTQQGEKRVQHASSLRSIAHELGASWQTSSYENHISVIEMNAVS